MKTRALVLALVAAGGLAAQTKYSSPIFPSVAPSLPSTCAPGGVVQSKVGNVYKIETCNADGVSWTETVSAVSLTNVPVTPLIVKGDNAGNLAPAAASDVVTLFGGCSGTLVLSADGLCHPAVGFVFTKPFSAATTLTVTATEHSCGTMPLWRVFDASGASVDVDGNLSSSGTITASWVGSFTGNMRVTCGGLYPNYQQTISGAGAVIRSGDFGLYTPYTLRQLYDSSNNLILVDLTTDSTGFNITTVESGAVKAIIGGIF